MKEKCTMYRAEKLPAPLGCYPDGAPMFAVVRWDYNYIKGELIVGCVTILKDNFATLKEAREYLAENALSLKQIKTPPIDFSEYVK